MCCSRCRQLSVHQVHKRRDARGDQCFCRMTETLSCKRRLASMCVCARVCRSTCTPDCCLSRSNLFDSKSPCLFVCYIDKVKPLAVCSCMCRACRHIMCVHYSDKGAPRPMKITPIHLPHCMKMFGARTLTHALCLRLERQTAAKRRQRRGGRGGSRWTRQ